MKITIGDNIRRLRREMNITQEALAEWLNLSVTAVSKWERGETYPDITLLFPLAEFFGISLDELMGYDAQRAEEEIQTILAQYRTLRREHTWEEAQAFIIDAYHEHPGDYRIMSAYMWNVGGDYADNDPAVLLSHKEEFIEICDKIDAGCTDVPLRLDAWNMRAKIAHAEGNTDRALEIYRREFPGWYQTWEQKSEQLFAKDTPQFSRQLRLNMLELAEFAANKKVKEIWFCREYTPEEKIQRGIALGDTLAKLAEETGDEEIWLYARHVYSDHGMKIHHFTGNDEAAARCAEKRVLAAAKVNALADRDDVVKEYIRIRYQADHVE